MHTSSLYVLFVNLLIRHALYGNSYAVNWLCFFAYFCCAAVEVVFEDENPDPIRKKEREAERGREREICSRPIKLIRRKEVTTLTNPYCLFWLGSSYQANYQYYFLNHLKRLYLLIWISDGPVAKQEADSFLRTCSILIYIRVPSKTVTMMDALLGSDHTTFFTVNGNAAKGS